MKTKNEPDLAAFDTVLFDFDGVLLKTMEDHHAAWSEIFSGFDLSIGFEELALMEGQSVYSIADQLVQKYSLDVTGKELADRKNAVYEKSARYVFYDDAIATVDCFVKLGFKTGLVTGAHRERLEHSVDPDFYRHFGTVVTADDVKQRKPHPEPYLTACSKLGSVPGNCLVIENAPLGITAARIAGMYCIALATTLDARHLEKADRILDSITDLLALCHQMKTS